MKTKSIKLTILTLFLSLFFTQCNNQDDLVKKENSTPDSISKIASHDERPYNQLGIFDLDAKKESTKFRYFYLPKIQILPNSRPIKNNLTPYNITEKHYLYVLDKNETKISETIEYDIIRRFNLWESPGVADNVGDTEYDVIYPKGLRLGTKGFKIRIDITNMINKFKNKGNTLVGIVKISEDGFKKGIGTNHMVKLYSYPGHVPYVQTIIKNFK